MFRHACQVKVDLLYDDHHEVEAFYNAIKEINKNSEYNVEMVPQECDMEDMTSHYIKPCIAEDNDSVLLVGASHGINIPRVFAGGSYQALKGFGTWLGIGQGDLIILKDYPQNDEQEVMYWEEWDKIISNASFVNNRDDRVFILHLKDGDLLLVEKEVLQKEGE